MKSSLPKLNLDLKSQSLDLEIIDLDADNMNLSENKEDYAESVMSTSTDRNNNSNCGGAAAVGEQVKKLDRGDLRELSKSPRGTKHYNRLVEEERESLHSSLSEALTYLCSLGSTSPCSTSSVTLRGDVASNILDMDSLHDVQQDANFLEKEAIPKLEVEKEARLGL